MRLKFEQLEQRLVLSGIGIDIDGPETAYVGDRVEYEVVVTNRGQLNSANPEVQTMGLFTIHDPHPVSYRWSELENFQWHLDGVSWASAEDSIELGPGETRVFTATGTITNEIEWFVLRVDMGPGLVDTHGTAVLDSFADAHTIGGAVQWSQHPPGTVAVPGGGTETLHSVEPAGDLNGDGFGDVYIITNDPYGEIIVEDGEEKYVTRLVRYTAFGTETSIELVPDERLVLPKWWESPSYSVGPLVEIGDVDGDGFGDSLIGDRRDLHGTGVATIYFGPNNRENFVVLSGQLEEMGFLGLKYFSYTPSHFPSGAGSLGDVNGDGFGDFFVADSFMLTHLTVLHGRDFGRDLPADIDGSGTVDFADFLVLAYNYGNENMTRSEGDLDGDGLVAFSDFIVLRDTFGQSKADVPIVSS